MGAKEQRASYLATEMAAELSHRTEEVEKLSRDTRRLENSLKLEAQAAQLERSTCDKFRVRCVDMEVRILKNPVKYVVAL